MDGSIVVILFAAVFVGAIIHGISGFAFGIIVLMVLPHFFTYSDSLALISFTTVCVLGYNAYLYRRHINWQEIPLALAVFVIADFFAVRLLKYVGENPIWHLLLGGIFILMAAYLIWGQERFKILPTKTNAVIFNGVGGVINGLFCVGGPITAMYFLAVSKSKEEYLGTTQMLFFINITIDFLLRALNGMVSKPILIYGVSSLWCIVLGLLVGKKLFDKINALTLRRIICGLMVLNGVVMLLK